MALYDYRCTNSDCSSFDERVEIEKPMMSLIDPECEECKQVMSKVWTPIAVTFKGGGFYRTDNPKLRHHSASVKVGGNNAGKDNLGDRGSGG